jgi:pre-mRNA-splicing factor CWC22
VKIHTSAFGRTGGVYIPPFKMRLIEKSIKDKAGDEYQRLTWDALKKSLNGLVNKVSPLNIVKILPEVFAENLNRGRGLLCRSLMKSQSSSPNFTPVYAALIAVINTKMPEAGELLCRRLISQWKKAFMRNQKALLLSTTKFLGHLVNQFVCGTFIPLQILALLLEKPTDDSVEVAVEFVKECGQRIEELCRKPFNRIFGVFRAILQEGQIDKRVQYMIENLFVVRKNQFSDHPAIIKSLDLVEENDQITHDDLSLDDEYTTEELGEQLNIFQFDTDYPENEKRYDAIRKEILGDSEAESDEEGSSASQEAAEEEEAKQKMLIEDQTELETTNLKRKIYLTIMSSLDFEECAHKLLKMGIKETDEVELCKMIVDCCAQEKTFRRFYGLLAQRFAMLKPTIRDILADICFPEQYEGIHMLETNKLRNVAMFFAHILHTDAIPWTVLHKIHLNEEETNSSKRIFVKILFKELTEYLGLKKVNERLQDPEMIEYFKFILPKDNPKNTRFAINYFTAIGLGGLTVDLRAHLKKKTTQLDKPISFSSSASSSDSDSSSDS